MNNSLDPDISPQKKSMYWVWVPNQNPKSIQILFYTFWYRNQQILKIFDTQKCLGLKTSDFF